MEKPHPETPTEKESAKVIDLDYIRKLKILPDCSFDHPPQHDFDGEDLAG